MSPTRYPTRLPLIDRRKSIESFYLPMVLYLRNPLSLQRTSANYRVYVFGILTVAKVCLFSICLRDIQESSEQKDKGILWTFILSSDSVLPIEEICSLVTRDRPMLNLGSRNYSVIKPQKKCGFWPQSSNGFPLL